ncbi:hypothetical protein Pmar_PMAR020344 [Perkinsus marinus ATCC 50983]|uniref:DDE Tnp4 domain-containing protein n=1 Tax=Perkinsus marinus (strain ATCC 50983 / TXsc) TaxID=423536 RepID=C5KFF4_PERM5|nr:hypothetical protein Pmar_PMAR020344 [Perkinsus marinus ATCC 50983]EER16814.1 hypothetical protein Pmar_PMAR020344 [Perkinsus marinus ATCC 50983]|eukprot:XP_002785018.1 hypothetical protein Pmar_PMAR020344 [Perkinsus marinus ATCC 50983]
MDAENLNEDCDIGDFQDLEDMNDIAAAGLLDAYPLADHYNPFETLSDNAFFESFRFQKTACLDVLRTTVPHLPQRASRRTGVQPFMRILFTLQYLGTGYPCRSAILTPYKNNHNPPLNPVQSRYQNRLCAARVVIEQAFGRLKMRFRILLSDYRGKVDTMPTVCLAACVLHNMAEKLKQPVREVPAAELRRPKIPTSSYVMWTTNH